MALEITDKTALEWIKQYREKGITRHKIENLIINVEQDEMGSYNIFYNDEGYDYRWVYTSNKEPVPEECYTKHYEQNFSYYSFPNEISVNFISLIEECMRYSIDKVFTIVSVTDCKRVMEDNNIPMSYSTFKRMVKRCVDYGFLVRTKYRGLYIINPYFASRCEKDRVEEQRRFFHYDEDKEIWNFDGDNNNV